MSGSKYWGEEKYPDAIYSVYLKKVRYVPPPNQNSGEYANSEEADHLQWETIRERVIKAGTLQRLVESLIDSEGQLDSRQFNIFFATYRTFAETEEVIKLITEWYDSFGDVEPSSSKQIEKIQDIKSTIKSILICWLDMYPEDFYIIQQNNESHTEFGFPLLEILISFSKATNLHDLKHKARKLRDKFKRIHQNGGLTVQVPSISRISFAITGYDPNVHSSMISNNTNNGEFETEKDERYAKMLVEAQERAQMFDISCENVPQIAEQLTFWDALLFKDLKLYQCQGSIWGKRNKLKPEAVYSVRATIDQFNAICQRVMTSIILPECQPQFRAQIIEKWIFIAKELLRLNNLSSLKAVLSSLQSQPIFRLKQTWSFVSKHSMAQFEELSNFFEHIPEDLQKTRNTLNVEGTTKNSPKKSPNGNHCRRTKSDINISFDTQGSVPYLGTFLTELQMLDQAYPSSTEEGLINFEKRRQEFEVLAKLRLYQSAARAYTIPMDQAFCVWFNYLPALDEKECFIRSLEVEPNGNDEGTPETRRKAGDGTPQHMPKINSLSKLFSGLGYSLGNSSFVGISEQRNQSFTKENEKRNSFGASSVNERSPGECSLSSTNQFLEKPPRGQRSRSQGARKDNRCKQQNMARGLGRIGQGISPSSVGSRNGMSQELAQPDFAASHRYSGSEFSPQHHFSPQNSLLLEHNENNKFTQSSDFGLISGERCEIGRFEGMECLNRMDSTDSHSRPFDISSASSSFTRPQTMGFDQSTSKKNPSNGTTDHLSSSFQKEILGRMKHFQKSTSSSSSRSSLEMKNQKHFGGASPSSISMSNCPREEQNFHLIRVGLDDSLQNEHQTTTNTNYKCIKVINGDRMPQVIQRALEKHLIDPNESPNYCLIQLLPDGGEFRFPDHCNPFYAVAPDPASPMLNCILRKRVDCSTVSNPPTEQFHSMAEAKKLNKEKRNNLLRWSSGFL